MNIEQLIHKFYEGDTTPEEERLLTEYFLNEENIDERWREDREVFLLLNDRQIHIPSAVSERLEQSIAQMAASQQSIPRKRTLFYWTGSAAAIALLCIGLFFTTREPSKQAMADTFSDPEEAALVAGQTLAFISAQLNNGLNKVVDTKQELEKVNQLLNKHFK